MLVYAVEDERAWGIRCEPGDSLKIMRNRVRNLLRKTLRVTALEFKKLGVC
jgi:hypothetical protein